MMALFTPPKQRIESYPLPLQTLAPTSHVVNIFFKHAVFVGQREGVDNTIEEGYRVLPDAGLQAVEGVDGIVGTLKNGR